MKTLTEITQQVSELSTRLQTQQQELLNLRQLNEQQIAEAKKLLAQSKIAQDWALHSYRIDRDGWIWRWDLVRKLYVKTAFRVRTPVIPCKEIEKRHLSTSLIDWLMSITRGNGSIDFMTQQEYDALKEHDDNILYVIYEEDGQDVPEEPDHGSQEPTNPDSPDTPPIDDPQPTPHHESEWKFGMSMPMVLS